MLSKKLTLYIPSTRFDSPITESEHNEISDRIGKILAKKFGGSSVVPTLGHYRADNGQVISEKINQITSYTETIGERELKIVRRLAGYLKAKLDQESVAFETNEGLDFV